jgi:hypothetical protein
MNRCRLPLQRRPLGDVERRLWGWLESGRWQVANKGTVDGRFSGKLMGRRAVSRIAVVAMRMRLRK